MRVVGEIESGHFSFAFGLLQGFYFVDEFVLLVLSSFIRNDG